MNERLKELAEEIKELQREPYYEKVRYFLAEAEIALLRAFIDLRDGDKDEE